MSNYQGRSVIGIMNQLEGVNLHEKKGGKFRFYMNLTSMMKNEPIDETIAQTTNRAYLGKLKSAASFMALAFSPV